MRLLYGEAGMRSASGYFEIRVRTACATDNRASTANAAVARGIVTTLVTPWWYDAALALARSRPPAQNGSSGNWQPAPVSSESPENSPLGFESRRAPRLRAPRADAPQKCT